MHRFVMHTNESACRKSGRLGMDHVCKINLNYVDEDDPLSGILEAEVFAIISTASRLKGYRKSS